MVADAAMTKAIPTEMPNRRRYAGVSSTSWYWLNDGQPPLKSIRPEPDSRLIATTTPMGGRKSPISHRYGGTARNQRLPRRPSIAVGAAAPGQIAELTR